MCGKYLSGEYNLNRPVDRILHILDKRVYSMVVDILNKHTNDMKRHFINNIEGGLVRLIRNEDVGMPLNDKYALRESVQELKKRAPDNFRFYAKEFLDFSENRNLNREQKETLKELYGLAKNYAYSLD